MKKRNLWPVKITIAAFLISVVMAVVTNGFIADVNIFVALSVLLVVILMGIVFDIIGIAFTVADETPFHSRSTKGYKGSREAIKLIRSADKVSSFCNDVIGDIAGVLSGGLGAAIAATLYQNFSFIPATVISMVVTALVASMTVGGKALGKGIAIGQSLNIVEKISVIIYYLTNITRIFTIRKKDR